MSRKRNWWERTCREIRSWWKQGQKPRKLRTLVNGIIILIFLYLLYLMLGGPILTMETRFRRMEQVHMVGPGKILGIETGDYLYYDHVLLAEDEEGVILYACDSRIWHRNDKLVYRQRRGDLMMLTLPIMPGQLNHHWDFRFPVVLFDRHPEAVRARIGIEVPGQENGYTVTCQRNHQGYFFGEIVHVGDFYSGTKAEWLQLLADLSNSSSGTTDLTVISARVRLYDQEDHLIHEETIELCSVSYENREKQKGES